MSLGHASLMAERNEPKQNHCLETTHTISFTFCWPKRVTWIYPLSTGWMLWFSWRTDPTGKGPVGRNSIYFDNNTVYQNGVKLSISNYFLKIYIWCFTSKSTYITLNSSPLLLRYTPLPMCLLYRNGTTICLPRSPKPEVRSNARLFLLGLISHIQLLTESCGFCFWITSDVHLLYISFTMS